MKTIILPTVRPQLFCRFLDSLDHMSGWDVCIGFQCYTKDDYKLIESHRNFPRITHMLHYQKRSPLFPLRVDMIEKWGNYDYWCSADDDIAFTQLTNTQSILDKFEEPSVGMISGNWAKTESMLHRSQFEDTFILQPIIFTGGGLFFSKSVVEYLINFPRRPYLFDDVQFSLISYLYGFDNYRYLGSLAVHGVQQKGGLRVLYDTIALEPNPPQWITLTPLSTNSIKKEENNYHIPTSHDITLKAKEMHLKHKR